jgi:hypothetical protein
MHIIVAQAAGMIAVALTLVANPLPNIGYESEEAVHAYLCLDKSLRSRGVELADPISSANGKQIREV